jgi:hypothetical protein
LGARRNGLLARDDDSRKNHRALAALGKGNTFLYIRTENVKMKVIWGLEGVLEYFRR